MKQGYTTQGETHARALSIRHTNVNRIVAAHLSTNRMSRILLAYKTREGVKGSKPLLDSLSLEPRQNCWSEGDLQTLATLLKPKGLWYALIVSKISKQSHISHCNLCWSPGCTQSLDELMAIWKPPNWGGRETLETKWIAKWCKTPAVPLGRGFPERPSGESDLRSLCQCPTVNLQHFWHPGNHTP